MEVQQNAKKTKEAAKIQRQKTAEMPMRKIELLEADKASLKSEILNLKGDITRMQEEAKSVHKQMSQEIASTQKDKEIKVAVSGEANEAKTNIWRLRAERAEQAQKRAEEAQNRTQREWDRALKIELDIVHHAAQKRQALACGESAAAARKAALAEGDMLWAAALQGLQGKYDDLESKMREANTATVGVAPVAAVAATTMADEEASPALTGCCMPVVGVALGIDRLLAPMMGIDIPNKTDSHKGNMVDGTPADATPDWDLELNDAAAAAARGDVPTISCSDLKGKVTSCGEVDAWEGDGDEIEVAPRAVHAM